MPRMVSRFRRSFHRAAARGAVLAALVVVTTAALLSHVPDTTARLETIAARTDAPSPVADARPTSTTSEPPASSTTVGSGSPFSAAHAEMARVPTSTAPAPPIAEPAISAARRAPELDTMAPPAPAPAPAPVVANNCVVRLHGKGGGGSSITTQGGVTYVAPSGNASGWGGRQWLYYPESGYLAGRASVVTAIDDAGCTRIIIDGFSNGAAFAAKLYCRGESFSGRLARVIVDDPVTDHAVSGCAPSVGVAVTLYWTGALEGQAQPGWSCAAADWTCEGGSTLGIAAYAAALGTPAKPSPMGGHTPYTNPPELTRF